MKQLEAVLAAEAVQGMKSAASVSKEADVFGETK
jgi:hypothetical protein